MQVSMLIYSLAQEISDRLLPVPENLNRLEVAGKRQCSLHHVEVIRVIFDERDWASQVGHGTPSDGEGGCSLERVRIAALRAALAGVPDQFRWQPSLALKDSKYRANR